MKVGAIVVFAFLFTLLLFTYEVEAGKNKDNKERDRRRKDRREKRRGKKTAIDNNPTILSEPTFPTVSPVETNEDVFGDPILDATKRPHRHHHKARGKDRREKAKKHKKDRERRREKGTGELAEPEIVSFDDMLALGGGEDPTDPAPAPAPTSKEDKMTEKVPFDVSANVTNLLSTTEEIGDVAEGDQRTTEKITDEPSPTPTFQAETQTDRRRGREGKRDRKNKDKRRNKEQKKDRVDEQAQDIEVQPTEFEFSPTLQPDQQTTTTQESRRSERRKNRDERRKDKKDKKRNKSPVAPEDAEEMVQTTNNAIPSPESETQTEMTESRERGQSKKDKDKRNRNHERQTNHAQPDVEIETKKKDKDKRNRDSNGERREREKHEKGVKRDRRKERLREPIDATNSSTLDECKSDRDCTQGSCCEIHEGSKICREYSHQEGQKCRDHCACHTGLICQAPEPTRRSQRNKKLGPSRCRVPGVNGMGGDFVGIVQDALEDVMETMKRRERSN